MSWYEQPGFQIRVVRESVKVGYSWISYSNAEQDLNLTPQICGKTC